MPTDIDVAIVGAGAAGIAAARCLHDRGLQVLLLEARDRLGGRAWTADMAGHPADMGCAWLHSADRNPWTGLAQCYGLAIDRKLPDWGWRFAAARQLTAEESGAREAAFDRLWEAMDSHDGPDASFAAKLPADDPWLPGFSAVTTYISGAEPAAISAVDLARYENSQVNWRVVPGYGHLVARHAQGVPVRLRTPVLAVDWSGKDVVLVTPAGQLRARAAILTVPPTVLLSEVIRFVPDLPFTKLQAAMGLPMGHVAKLMLRHDGAPPWDVGPDCQVVGHPNRLATAIYHLCPLGRPLVEAYWGGSLALDLERAGTAAMAAFALDELSALFGSAVRERLTPALASAWASEPWSQGAYTYARPGAADGRAILAEPLGDRLFFAGEACSRHAYSTAHGAYLTGIEAATRALQSLA